MNSTTVDVKHSNNNSTTSSSQDTQHGVTQQGQNNDITRGVNSTTSGGDNQSAFPAGGTTNPPIGGRTTGVAPGVLMTQNQSNYPDRAPPQVMYRGNENSSRAGPLAHATAASSVGGSDSMYNSFLDGQGGGGGGGTYGTSASSMNASNHPMQYPYGGGGGADSYHTSMIYPYQHRPQQPQQHHPYMKGGRGSYDGGANMNSMPQSMVLGGGQGGRTMAQDGGGQPKQLETSELTKGNTATTNQQTDTEGNNTAGKQPGSAAGSMQNDTGTGRASREDDLEVAKACLNLRQDGKEDPSSSSYPSSYPPPPSAASYYPPRYSDDPRSHHPQSQHQSYQLPFQQYHPSFQQQPHQYQSAMFIPSHHSEFPPGYLPPHMAPYGSGGMVDTMSGQFYPPTRHYPNDKYSQQMMLIPPGVGSGAGSDFSHMKAGIKRPFDQDSTRGPLSSGMDDKRGKTSPSQLSIPSKKITGKMKKGKRPADMPRRPLSAYNFFFSEERERVLAEIPDPDGEEEDKGDDDSKKANSEESIKDNTKRLLALRESNNSSRRPHRKTHGKIGFKDLAKLIGERWRVLTPEKRQYYTNLADKDLGRYKDQMKEYHKKNKWSFLGESGGGNQM